MKKLLFVAVAILLISALASCSANEVTRDTKLASCPDITIGQVIDYGTNKTFEFRGNTLVSTLGEVDDVITFELDEDGKAYAVSAELESGDVDSEDTMSVVGLNVGMCMVGAGQLSMLE